jgi:hypothetical protein
MSTATQVEQLRATARQLQAMSTRIGSSRALTVYSLAGPDTWVGPTPLACCASLLAMRSQLLANQQTLADTARRLERRADALEQQPVVSLAS